MNSDDQWEFNAPKFVDFEAGNLHEGNVDYYFEYDHESGRLVKEDVSISDSTELAKSEHAVHNYNKGDMSVKEELRYESSNTDDANYPEDEEFRAASEVEEYELYEVQYACARRSSVCGAEEVLLAEHSPKLEPRRRSASVSNRAILVAETPEVLQRIESRLGRKFVVQQALSRNLAFDDEESIKEKSIGASVSKSPMEDDSHLSRLDRNFASMLRQPTPISNKHKPASLQLTEPQPFQFAAAKPKPKPVTIKGDADYTSFAETVLKLQKATPDRFRSRPASHRPEFPKPTVMPHCTKAQTPNFATSKRQRPIHAISREEQEAKELEEIKKHQFKAHPIKTEVVKQKPVLPKPAPRPVTRPQPFKLSEPNPRRVQLVQDKPTSHVFHARPAPMKALKNFKPVERPSTSCTVPQTPNFSAAGKAAMAARRRAPPAYGSTTSLNSASSSSQHSDDGQRPRCTKAEPFSFAEREKYMLERKQERIMKQLEEERKSHQFHAHPAPNFSRPKGIPARPVASATQPKPFQLSADTLGQQKLAKFQAELAENERKAREAAMFKAHKPVVLEKAPFIPERPGRILDDVTEFKLNTEVRAEKRLEFDEFVKAREQEKLADMQRAEQNRLQAEEEERMRLRAQAVVKAQPIRLFKAVDLKGSERPLTVPQTPQFRNRAHERTLAMDENSLVNNE